MKQILSLSFVLRLVWGIVIGIICAAFEWPIWFGVITAVGCFIGTFFLFSVTTAAGGTQPTDDDWWPL